jgi:cytochrome bd ubiquinol oxidase subunit I
VLPTFLGTSSVHASQVLFSLLGFVLFYSTLAVVDVFLMLKYTKRGPQMGEGDVSGLTRPPGRAPMTARRRIVPVR